MEGSVRETGHRGKRVTVPYFPSTPLNWLPVMWAFYFFYHKWWPLLTGHSQFCSCWEKTGDLNAPFVNTGSSALPFGLCLAPHFHFKGVWCSCKVFCSPRNLAHRPSPQKGRIVASYKWIPQMPRFSDGLLPEPFWYLGAPGDQNSKESLRRLQGLTMFCSSWD